MKRVRILLYALLQTVLLCAQETLTLTSPTGVLNTEIRLNDQLVQIDLSDVNRKLLEIKTLQFDLNKKILDGVWGIVNHSNRSVNQTWSPIYGETSLISDRYNELAIELQSDKNQKRVTLLLRLYDEGLAFRYKLDELDFWNCTLTNERTQFLFDHDCDTWVSNHAQGAYYPTTLNNQQAVGDRPQVVKLNDQKFVAIGEAALVDYARMKLGKSENGIGLQSYLSGKVNLDMARYQSPWRYVMVGNHPGELVQNNYFVLNLNEPNQIANTSWIKPGSVIREVTLTTEGGLACVDFAAKHHIDYVEFDAGWYGPEDDELSDATTITVDPKRSKGPLDLHKVIAHANAKGVGIIVYVNQKALHNQLDEILPLYKEWGIKGVKYGFVDVGSQYATAWLHQAIRKAAKYELMVDVHDEYRPTGYSRTYPNLMTQEGIRGDEESTSLEQTLYTFYNRMICGAGDQTNCYFSDRVAGKMGGRAAQLAKLITLYSPWQFIYWYDRPAQSPFNVGGAGSVQPKIVEDAVTDFYTSIPTVWEETRFIDGEMGKYSIVARRSASDWFIAILNAGPDRDVALPLKEILQTPEEYETVLYHEASPQKKEVVNIKRIKTADIVSVKVHTNSGAVLHIIPIKK